MVTLTNNTTSTPSVTDVAVSSSSPTNKNTVAATIGSEPFSTQKFGYPSSEYSSNAISTFFTDYIEGASLPNFPGGRVSASNVVLRVASTPVSTTAYSALYLDNSLVAVSQQTNIEVNSGTTTEVSFTFNNDYVPQGNLFVAFQCGDDNLSLRNITQNSSYLYNTYNEGLGSFPQSISVLDNGANTVFAAVDYYPFIVDNLSSGRVATWSDLNGTWDSYSGEWNEYSDIEVVNNL